MDKKTPAMGGARSGMGRLSSVSARPMTCLAGGLGALLLVRLAALMLNRTDLFFDEAQYWSWAEAPAFGYYSKPPLIAWLIAASEAVCGAGEACVRVSSPLLHTATAVAIYALASRLYDQQTGVLAALAFALIPGVSLSAGIISTDVPLLCAWALALLGFAALFDTRAWWPTVVLGVAFGAGLNAKYAMAWFILCAAVYLAMTPERRGILRDGRLWAALALGVGLILPNLMWNQAHSFATFAHTADNAKWSGGLIHPLKTLEFLGSQFGVFGPLYFAGLLVIAWHARTTQLAEADRMMLAFSIPLIVVITVQAFLSRAHPNWAAAAYVSGVIVVIATMVREAEQGWLKAGFALHVAVLAVLIAATSTAGLVRLPFKGDPLARTMGWHALADAVREEIARAQADRNPYEAILTDKRAVTAELLYYVGPEWTAKGRNPLDRWGIPPIRAFRAGDKPHDHFELTRPYTAGNGGPVLLVSLSGAIDQDATGEAGAPSVASSFTKVQHIADRDIPAGLNATRRVTFYALSGYKGP